MNKPLVIQRGEDIIISYNGIKRVTNSKKYKGKSKQEIARNFLQEMGAENEKN